VYWLYPGAGGWGWPGYWVGGGYAGYMEGAFEAVGAATGWPDASSCLLQFNEATTATAASSTAVPEEALTRIVRIRRPLASFSGGHEVNDVECARSNPMRRPPLPATAFVTAMLSFLGGCEHGEPPAPAGAASVALPELDAGGWTAAAPAFASGSPAEDAAGSRVAPPALREDDAAHLPQTRDMPSASGRAFETRVAALWDAIVHDTPSGADAFFFPLGAYEQVKDVGDPAADWRHRLLSAYHRDVHALHERLGDAADRAKLVGLDVPQAHSRWVEPGEEYNKIGYFRVFGSKLRYEVDGQTQAFDVKSLISWRGSWYLVHLSAIK
jgi:hypothetical protein